MNVVVLVKIALMVMRMLMGVTVIIMTMRYDNEIQGPLVTLAARR